METEPQPNPIAQLNDAFRRSGQDVMVTPGVRALPDMLGLIHAVQTFDRSTPDNDPWGEHDCAILTVNGRRVLFKIDYYDLELQCHSPDASDPAVTQRVMTVMLAEEY